jgi:hypothetical protein
MASRKKPDNPVTPEAADAFAMFMRKWQEQLNLSDWRIERSAKPAGRANLAEVNRMSLPDRLATYRIGDDFGSMSVNEATLEQIACHEVLHIFLRELIDTAKDAQTVTADTLSSAEHRVVNTLVQLLVPDR